MDLVPGTSHATGRPFLKAKFLFYFGPAHARTFFPEGCTSFFQIHAVFQLFEKLKIGYRNDCGDILSMPVQRYPFTAEGDLIDYF